MTTKPEPQSSVWYDPITGALGRFQRHSPHRIGYTSVRSFDVRHDTVFAPEFKVGSRARTPVLDVIASIVLDEDVRASGARLSIDQELDIDLGRYACHNLLLTGIEAPALSPITADKLPHKGAKHDPVTNNVYYLVPEYIDLATGISHYRTSLVVPRTLYDLLTCAVEGIRLAPTGYGDTIVVRDLLKALLPLAKTPVYVLDLFMVSQRESLKALERVVKQVKAGRLHLQAGKGA